MAKEPNDQNDDLHDRLPITEAQSLNEPEEERDLHDISKIQLTASNTKALTAAGRMTVNEASSEAQNNAQRERQKRDAQQSQELANLARWNGQMTTVGGVQMTNEQAQKARQNVIDNGDAYADWAIKKGLIKEEDRESFNEAARRKKELEDKRGRGTLTAAEAEEAERLNRSRVGQAVDAATAQNHLDKGVAPVASSESARSSVSAASQDGRGINASKAPDLTAAFAANAPLPPSVAPQEQPGPSRSVQASGLNL